MKKKVIIMSIVALVLIGIIGGMSYAYFTIGNNNGENNVVTSGTMSLLLTDGQEVTANNLIPGQYVEKTFKVKNTGTVDTRYDVYFSEVINTFVDKTDLVYTLTSSDGGYNTTGEIQVPDTETKIVNQYLISPNEEHTYTLRITFKLKETIQNVNMGRTFTAKININEFNLNSGEHFLKLIDASGNEVDKQILSTNKENYTLALNNTALTNSTNIYCNNGGIPTISGNTLNVAGITNDTECRISNDIVDTINNKLTTTKTGIVMTNDQSNVETMIVPASKEVVFDLNGKKVKSLWVNETSTEYNGNHRFIISNGILTINDMDGVGGLFNGPTYRAVENNGGTLIVNSGIYSGRQDIFTTGSNSYTVINGGYFESRLYEDISMQNCINCNVIVNNANLNGPTGIAASNNNSGNNKYIVNNVTSNNTGYSIYTYNSINTILEINNGTFISVGRTIEHNLGTINIKGGTFESSGNTTVVNMGNGTINISNNTNKVYIANFSSNENIWSPKAIMNYGNGNINIQGNIANNCTENDRDTTSGICIYTNNGRAILNEYIENNPATGTININGAYIVSNNNYAINNYDGTINIKNSKVSTLNYNYSIYNSNTGNINICSVDLLNNVNLGTDKVGNNTAGYIYYHKNAFGSVTPTFSGITENIQVKDSVCS